MQTDWILNIRGLTRDGEVLLFDGVPVKEMEAWPLRIAALKLGFGYMTLRRRIRLGLIRMTKEKTIPRSEVRRYLRSALPPLSSTYAARKLA